MRRAIVAVGVIIGAYLIVRGAVELFVIDISDPATYRDDWGGPSLVGVLAVHILPGVLAAGIMVWAWMRRGRVRRGTS